MKTLDRRIDRTYATAAALAVAGSAISLYVTYVTSPLLALGVFACAVLAYGCVRIARLQARHRLLRGVAARAYGRMLEQAHRATLEHGRRIAPLVRQTARELGLSESAAEELEVAAILHDIGKADVDGNILDKPGPLTSEEYEVVKQHVIDGARMLETDPELKRIADWIRHHHERVDGRGYPDGLKGGRIPLASRILAVADAYDAMVCGGDAGGRPYRKLVPREEALRELRHCAGRQFDLEAVHAFCRAEYEWTRGTVH
jgi:putative nucleotidyltransferase with HDIG domain